MDVSIVFKGVTYDFYDDSVISVSVSGNVSLGVIEEGSANVKVAGFTTFVVGGKMTVNGGVYRIVTQTIADSISDFTITNANKLMSGGFTYKLGPTFDSLETIGNLGVDVPFHFGESEMLAQAYRVEEPANRRYIFYMTPELFGAYGPYYSQAYRHNGTPLSPPPTVNTEVRVIDGVSYDCGYFNHSLIESDLHFNPGYISGAKPSDGLALIARHMGKTPVTTGIDEYFAGRQLYYNYDNGGVVPPDTQLNFHYIYRTTTESTSMLDDLYQNTGTEYYVDGENLIFVGRDRILPETNHTITDDMLLSKSITIDTESKVFNDVMFQYNKKDVFTDNPPETEEVFLTFKFPTAMLSNSIDLYGKIYHDNIDLNMLRDELAMFNAAKMLHVANSYPKKTAEFSMLDQTLKLNINDTVNVDGNEFFIDRFVTNEDGVTTYTGTEINGMNSSFLHLVAEDTTSRVDNMSPYSFSKQTITGDVSKVFSLEGVRSYLYHLNNGYITVRDKNNFVEPLLDEVRYQGMKYDIFNFEDYTISLNYINLEPTTVGFTIWCIWVDSDNYLILSQLPETKLRIRLRVTGISSVFNVSTGDILSDFNKYNITFSKVGNNMGLYVDGVQVLHVTNSVYYKLIGEFVINARGDGTFTGNVNMDEFFVEPKNTFYASPNSSLTDTITGYSNGFDWFGPVG